jgi:hypothetical protein
MLCCPSLLTFLSVLHLTAHVAIAPVVFDPVSLELRVGSAEPVVIDALRTGDRAFLLARAFFRYVGVGYAEGAERGEFVVGGEHRVLVIGDSVRRANGALYVDAEHLGALLCATVRVDWSELEVTLTGDSLLPMARRWERAQRIRQFNTSSSVSDNWDEDDFSVLRSGAFELDYGVVFPSWAEPRNKRQYSLAIGSAFFGGTLTARIQTGGRQAEAVWFLSQERAPLVRHVLIGDIPPLGSRGYVLLGVSVSNAPGTYSATYDTMVVRGVVPDGWEVDLERNGELVAGTAGDSIARGGAYAFPVPVVYGTTRYTVVAYGPDGEVRRTSRFATVRSELIPVRRFYYAVSAGRCRFLSRGGCTYAADAQLRFSPVRRVTVAGAGSTEVFSSRHFTLHEVSAVLQATDALSLVGANGNGGASKLFVQYVPSTAVSLQMGQSDSTFSYSGYWAGHFRGASTAVTVAGIFQSGASHLRSNARFSATVSGHLGRFAPFVQRRRYSSAVFPGFVDVASVAHSWTGGGDMWVPLTTAHFLRMHVDGLGTSAGWSVEPGASVALPYFVRLDVRARWQPGDARPATSWSLGKTVSFAAVRSDVSTAPGMTPTAMQSVTGALRVDPGNWRVIPSPYSRIANAPLVTTLR